MAEAPGPADFDPTEAMSFLVGDGAKYQAYRDMCAAMGATAELVRSTVRGE